MRSSLAAAVELRLGKKRRRLAQNLIGAPELRVLPLQLLDPLTVGQSCIAMRIGCSLRTPHPVVERLRCAADLLGYGLHRCPARGVLVHVLLEQAYRPVTHFSRIFLRCVSHGSILSSDGASGK